MNGKLKKNIGFSMIIFSFFFLFEPSYALIDPLPDLIGYTILCLSLINLADINDKINSALKAFSKGILLSLLRYACLIIISYVFGDDQRSIGQLLFVFVFAFFELYMIIPGYKHLFEGLLTLATFENGEAVFYKKRENNKNVTEKLYFLTLIFLIIKNAFCCLPEFTTLETNSSNEFINIMRILAMVLISPLCIIWLVNIVKYFVNIKNDKPFIESLETKYKKSANESPDFFIGRVLRIGIYMIIVSFILTFDIFSEGVNVLPDIFAYSGLILTALFLHKYSKKWGLLAITSSLGALSSLWVYMTEKSFYERYLMSSVHRDIEAYEHYYLLLSAYILQAVLFCAVLASLTAFLCDIYNDHIRAKQIGHDIEKKESNTGFIARICIFSALGLLSAAASVYHILALTQDQSLWIFYSSGVISSAISIASVISLLAISFFMLSEIKKNYSTYL